MTVYRKLADARAKFHALDLKKSGRNQFAGYSYFELADFLIPGMAVMREAGLCPVVSFTADVATMSIVDVETGEAITITSPMGSAALKGCHEVQNIGAVQTYQRRYLWMAALEIVEHDAVDAATGSDKPALKITPTSGAWEALDATKQALLIGIATDVTELVSRDQVSEANATIADAELTSEEKVALWTRLDSKTRSALKKANERKAA